MRNKPAVTGIGCMNKMKVMMRRIQKDRDKEERVVLAIPVYEGSLLKPKPS